MSDLLTIKDIAPLAGLSRASVAVYHQAAQRRRREGRPEPKDMPQPDMLFGRTPTWKPETVQAWIEARAS